VPASLRSVVSVVRGEGLEDIVRGEGREDLVGGEGWDTIKVVAIVSIGDKTG